MKENGKKFKVQEIQEIMKDILEAVNIMHINMNNILIDDNLNLRVIGFEGAQK
jgi:hypothetical protein